jgi:hypothetical protein
MAFDWFNDLVKPAGTYVLGAGGGALLTWAIRALTKKGDEEKAFRRVFVSVTKHQNFGIRSVVVVNKDRLNGSYDATVKHLDDADAEVDSYLDSKAFGAKK